MNDTEVVEVTRAGHNSKELQTINNTEGEFRKTASGLTSCKRFAPGLDLVYSITFPFCIQAETMTKE